MCKNRSEIFLDTCPCLFYGSPRGVRCPAGRQVGMGLIEVKVMVEEDRLAEFYANYGKWMAGQPLASNPASETSTLELLPWFDTQEDLALAQELWVKLPERAQAMFGILIDSPEKKISAAVIGSSLDIPHGISGVAGVLAWPGRYAAAIGKKLPVLKEEGPPGQGSDYWMTKQVAELFDRARSAV